MIIRSNIMLRIFGLFLGKMGKHITALAFYPFIFVSKDATLTPQLINHERIHLRQQIEMLILPFYIWYLIEYYTKGYWNISFEREAYRNQDNPHYLTNRPLFNFTKHI